MLVDCVYIALLGAFYWVLTRSRAALIGALAAFLLAAITACNAYQYEMSRILE
jgi:hypothetical protein